MSDLQKTINDIARGLHKAEIIELKTLRELEDDELPALNEYTGEEVQALRKRQKLSQAVFAKYLNISPATVTQIANKSLHLAFGFCTIGTT